MSAHLNLSTGKFLNSSTLYKLSDALLLDVSSGEIVMSNLLVPRAGVDLFKLASLDLNFAQYKALTDRVSGNNLITFSRASSGTYVGSDGLIKTATSDTPRFDHDPSTGKSLGLLVEENRTNLLQQSEDYSTTWTRFNVNASVNAITAPDGTTTADKLVENSSNNFHRVRQGISSGVTGTFSIFLKADERNRVNLGTSDTNLIAQFDLSAGSIVSGTGSIQSFGNGWYRCSISSTFTSSGPYLLLRNSSSEFYTGDGTSGVYAWGAQLEANATFATSYIPTSGSSVTRSADIASITGSNFSSWYNQSEGTVFVKSSYVGLSSSSTGRIYDINDGTTSNRHHLIIRGANNDLRVQTRKNSVDGFSESFSVPAVNNLFSNALGYKLNDCASSLDGGNTVNDNTVLIPTVDRCLLEHKI